MTQSSNAGNGNSGKTNPVRKPSKPASTTPSKQPAKSGSSSPRIVATGSIRGHDYVDLGLSVKWATCNVGATSPSGYSDYFAWGETSPKSEYTEGNSVTYKKNMGDIAGDSRYDAARANWGGSWRMPTAAEIKELANKCKTRWTTYNGHKGHLVMGPNGKSIFFLLPVGASVLRRTTWVRTAAIGVPRRMRAKRSALTTWTSALAISAGIGTTATTGTPCGLSQNEA